MKKILTNALLHITQLEIMHCMHISYRLVSYLVAVG